MNLEKYEKWLINHDNKKESSAKSYKSAIPKLIQHYKENKGVELDFFTISMESLEGIVKSYSQTGKYSVFGEKSNATYRNAMNALLRYRKYKLNAMESELDNFKKILEYFVCHLEYVANEKDINTRGYDTYIKGISDFNLEGNGYKGDKIQNQISKWDSFTSGKICVNIKNKFNNYKTKSCYLNWLHTGINIIASWNGNIIDSLFLEVYHGNKTREEINEKNSINDLGLFINNGISDDLKSFFESFVKLHNNKKELDKIEKINTSQNNFKLNQILYGPPGTGKTYNTILEAAKIVENDDKITYAEAQSIFNDNLGNQIEFVTFHQNYSYEDFIQGLRPDTELSGELSFFKKDGVFKRIADQALKNLEALKDTNNIKKDFIEVFSEFIKPLNDEEKEELEVKMKKNSFYITEVGEKSIQFRKANGESKHTLSIATLNKMYDKGVNDIIAGGLQPYYNPLLAVLLENGKNNNTSVDRKNYVIIIDEINRANISRVFGELITLIEKDKRSEGEIPLTATLPSGDKFIVPSNLYIIGTMNTADKSIALLDIALRRRFDFVPMYPKYAIEGIEIHDVEILEKINEQIISRKGHDFTIGHSYFMGDDYDLVNTINNKVIPLLLEYFMNDIEEVKNILKSANIEVEGWPLQYKDND